MDRQTGFTLWLRWIGANSLAELFGLGSTLAIDFVIVSRLTAESLLASIISIFLFAATGAIEGTVVGLLQWSVLRRPLPQVSRRSWLTFTVAGAVVAWFFGSLPSTLMELGAQESGAAVQEPEAAVVLLLAAGMGLFLGLVLGIPQWLALRKAVRDAWLWIPANCAAWALGMPAIFATIDLALKSASMAGTLAIIAVGLLIAGALVGAVHGLALVRLAYQMPMRLGAAGAMAGKD